MLGEKVIEDDIPASSQNTDDRQVLSANEAADLELIENLTNVVLHPEVIFHNTKAYYMLK